MRFTACACGLQYFVRLKRLAWMCLVPTRRHYFCAKCRERQFLPGRALRLVSWSLPCRSVPALEGLQRRAR